MSKPDKKHEIVLATISVLKKSGLPMLSYDAIAEELGLSRQNVRYYFGDPDTLMIAVCDHLAGTYRDSLIAGVMKAEGPDRLDLFLNFYFDLLEDMPKPADDEVYDALMALAAGSPKIQNNLRAQYSLLGQVLSHEFAVEYPSLSTQASGELSYLFVCLMYGHWKMVATLGLSREHRYVTRKSMDRLIQSYVTNSTELGPETPIWKQDAEI